MTIEEFGQLFVESRGNIRDLNLQNMDFGYAFLTGATFNRCNLQGADFTNANLTSAVFIDCDLSDAVFPRHFQNMTLLCCKKDGLKFKE